MSREMVLIPKHKYEAVLQKREETVEGGQMENESRSEGDSSTNDRKQEKTQPDDGQNLETFVNITIPAKYRDQVLRLLFYLKKQPSISWNERGEVSINGEVISNSHIIDLVREIVLPIKGEKQHQKDYIVSTTF